MLNKKKKVEDNIILSGVMKERISPQHKSKVIVYYLVISVNLSLENTL